MRVGVIVMAGLGLVVARLPAQGPPVKVATILLGYSCPEQPATVADTIYSAEDLTPAGNVESKSRHHERVQTLEFGTFHPSVAPPSGGPGVAPQTTLQLVLDTTGGIELCSAEVVAENNREWTRELLSLLAHATFAPVLKDGHPVRTRFRVKFVPYHGA